jgi:hypothetical protein
VTSEPTTGSQPPAGSSASSVHPNRDGSAKAQIWSAVITAVGAIVVALITLLAGLWHLGDNKQASVPLSISITSPKRHVSPDGEAFSGQVKGLKPGQTIWLSVSRQPTP